MYQEEAKIRESTKKQKQIEQPQVQVVTETPKLPAWSTLSRNSTLSLTEIQEQERVLK